MAATMKMRLLQLQGHVQQLAGNADFQLRSTTTTISAAGSNRIELPAAPLQRLPFDPWSARAKLEMREFIF